MEEFDGRRIDNNAIKILDQFNFYPTKTSKGQYFKFPVSKDNRAMDKMIDVCSELQSNLSETKHLIDESKPKKKS